MTYPPAQSLLNVLPEHFVVQHPFLLVFRLVIDLFVSPIPLCCSDASSSHLSSATSSTSLSPSRKRRIRYGRDDFGPDLEFSARRSSRHVQFRAQKQKNSPDRACDCLQHRHQYRQPKPRLSETSSVSDTPPVGSTTMTTTPPRPPRTHDKRPKFPLRPRTRSPALISPRGH